VILARRSAGTPALLAALLAAGGGPASVADDVRSRCGTVAQGSARLVALHRYAAGSGERTGMTMAPADDRDENHVALLADRGDLVIRRRPFDLDSRAVRLTPNGSGGYDPAVLALGVDAPGTTLGISTDGAREVELPFSFPFFGQRYRSAFVNADGHLTFGGPDDQAGDRGLGRLLAGPPGVAAFFADLDPSRAGSLTAVLAADRAAFVWTAVPGRGQINRNTFEVALHPTGAIDLAYGPEMQTREGVVGIVPGRTFDLTPADLARAVPVGSSGALVERFSETEKVDLVSVGRRFYAAHPDAFDQLVVYTTRPLNPVAGTLAFELNVKNEVRGIGIDQTSEAAVWGSAGRLQSVVYMDAIDQYLGVDGFEILGHEVGHRWLARFRFRDRTGSLRGALLGRADVHWSFFLDTQASLLEGNAIRDLGGGRFETTDFTRRFSALDQYAMGLRTAAEVPPFFYVDTPDDFRPNRPYKASASPEAGVTFTGTRRDVTIEDVIAAMGPRLPATGAAPHEWRIAFVLVSDGPAPSDVQRAAVARIRGRFEPFFREATDGRGSVDTTLP
jgi:hypothetical protein